MNLTDYRDITALLQRHGFHFSKSLGQNFLTAAWVPQQIAAEIGKRWGVGKEKDNGVVILVQPKTAHSGGKVAIAVGKGLEPMLTDVCCQGIVSDIMLPKLRTEDYYGAVSAAVADLVRTISMMQQ